MQGVVVRSGKMPRPTLRAADEGKGRLPWCSPEMGWPCWWVGAMRTRSLRPNMFIGTTRFETKVLFYLM